MNTENIDEPFAEKEPTEKVIVGGRSLLFFIDKQGGQDPLHDK